MSSIVQGVVLYDGQCGFCSHWVRDWGRGRSGDADSRLPRWMSLGLRRGSECRVKNCSPTYGCLRWRPADFRSRCLFICDETDLVGVALLCDFQSARLQPADPRGLRAVCAEPLLRLACVQAAAALNSSADRKIVFSRRIAPFGRSSAVGPPVLCRFLRGTYWKPHKICIKCCFSTARCVTMRMATSKFVSS